MASPLNKHDHGTTLDDWQQLELPKCPVCFEKLGSNGGGASLECGHKACLSCLQEIQTHNIVARCPVCRIPFGPDIDMEGNFNDNGLVELEWPGTPKFDDESADYETCNPQEKAIEFDCVEQHFRPCAYEEFNTWSPVTYPQQEVVSDSGSCCRIWPSDDKRVIYTGENLQLNLNRENLASRVPSVLSKSVTLPGERGGVLASQDKEVLSVGIEDTWASVHIPSAPPLLTQSNKSTMVLKSLLDAEPPQWIPDSAHNSCMQCNSKFQPLTRGRHHCRFCGGIFCRSCSKGRCLLPFKFMQRDPQRVCDACYESLEPIQDFLINMISNAAQIAVHDVTDATCMRGWLNTPIGLSMQDEIYKATNTLRNFCKVGAFKMEQTIPGAILRGAKGLAILTVVKVGVVLTYKMGTGLLVARRNDGSWSPPAAIMSCGLGWGLQVGGELVDFIIVLQSTKAVKAFSGRVHFSAGAGLSASVGPLGRLAEADIRVGDRGAAACYTYSCSQGAFIGASFEGNVVTSRIETNARFYGDTYLTPDYVLFGPVPTPKAAAPLYNALQDLFATVGV